MSEIVTTRVPKELKEQMQELDTNWSEEIRAYIERRVRELSLLKLLEEIEADPLRPKVPDDSTALIREDRER
ncbi:MAG: hypothetical protein Q8O47_01130 [Candidatus Bathyarchaeota archaeon]|jgi:hypothetical protein|nr:hypothetical protein [Candidatus Bathyarchaeota archaeon]